MPYVTAFRALHDRAGIRSGETLFIHGASGGVGVAAIQIARASGLTVIGSASTPTGLDLVRAQGAQHVLNHRESGYLDKLKDLTQGRGPDVILENLANVNLDNDLTAMAYAGRIVIVGNRGRIEIDPRKVMSKDGAIVGMALWNTKPEDLTRIYRALDAGFQNGLLAPVVGQRNYRWRTRNALTKWCSSPARRARSCSCRNLLDARELLVDHRLKLLERLRPDNRPPVHVHRRRGVHADLLAELEVSSDRGSVLVLSRQVIELPGVESAARSRAASSCGTSIRA